MLRIGILSAARIATMALLEPAADNPDVVIAAIAARDRMRAEEFADEHGIEHVVDTYEELCTSDLIDAIYVATPASLHRKWTLAALAGGKHVLCEKPIGANADDARAMVAAATATGLVMMEAFHWRYHPMASMIRSIVDDEIGPPTRVAASFTVGYIPTTDIRFDPTVGGGALMDLGCYPIQWVRFVAGREPSVVSAVAHHVIGPVDVEIEAELDFGSGCTGRVHCSMVEGVPFDSWLRVEGERGTLLVKNPLAPQLGNDLHVVSDTGERHEQAPLTTTYTHQLRAFVDAVANGTSVPTGGQDSISSMTVIDEIYTAAGMAPRPAIA
jgi:predicted dehydrogenase